MQQYNFNGEDLDESTQSLLREAGKDEDFVHCVIFFAIFKKTLAGSGHNYGTVHNFYQASLETST